MKCRITVLFLLCCCFARAQNMEVVDSLKNALSQAKADSSRAMILSELSFQYHFAKPDLSMQYAQQALNLSREINYKAGEASAMNNIAFLFRESGNLPMAMELLLKVMQLSRENHLDNEGALSMVRLGNIYRDLKDYSAALSYQHQGLSIVEKTHYKRGITIALMLIGQTFQELNQLDSAMYYEERAKAIVDTFKFPEVVTTMLNIIGRIQSKLGNYHLALDYFHQSAEISQRYNDRRTSSLVYSNMAQTYIKLNQTDSAIASAGKALAIAQESSSKASTIIAATTLSDIYAKLDGKKAFEYYKLAMEAKDSLYSSEKLQALQNLTFSEQERERNIESEKALYRNKIRQYLLMAGAVVFLLVAIILYRNNRQKLKINRYLEETLANLKSTQTQLIQSEKMASLGELSAGIAHEIQNPLNFVNNFSEVSNELVEEMKAALAKGDQQEAVQIAGDISQNLQKINHHGKRAESIVKGMLEHSRAGTGQKELTDINAIADEYLRLSYQGMRAKDKGFNATIETHFDPTINKISLVPQDVARVLLNLYNNAFYAVNERMRTTPNGYQPAVSVQTRNKGDKTEISVKDNGNGIPEPIVGKVFQPFFTTKPAGQGTGLGLSLSYDIVKAHRGEIRVITKTGEGTEFIVLI